jgi:hypothetical protein
VLAERGLALCASSTFAQAAADQTADRSRRMCHPVNGAVGFEGHTSVTHLGQAQLVDFDLTGIKVHFWIGELQVLQSCDDDPCDE